MIEIDLARKDKVINELIQAQQNNINYGGGSAAAFNNSGKIRGTS